MFQIKLANQNPYSTSMNTMRLRLLELQELDKKIQKIRAIKKLPDCYKKLDGVLHYQGLLFIPKLI